MASQSKKKKATKATPKKRTAKKASKAGARRRKAAPERWLRGRLPPQLERVDLVVRAVERGEDEVSAAVERLQAAYHDLLGRFGGLEQQARDEAERRVEDILGRVRETRAAGAFEQLPERAVEELDELLDRMGLVRKARFEEELEKAKKRAKSAGRRAALKELANQTAVEA